MELTASPNSDNAAVAAHPQRDGVAVCFGTRPEAIKVAPIVAAMRARAPEVPLRIVCTGQHHDLLDGSDALAALADVENLHAFEQGQPLSRLVARMIDAFGEALRRAPPRLVVVQGDTASAFAGAAAAFYAGIPVVHVEAGLRTRDPHHPFPEEMHRTAIARMASLHLAPTALARMNLLTEGVADAAIAVVGNTGQDAVRQVRGMADAAALPPWANAAPYALVTIHRRESARAARAIAHGIARGSLRAGIRCAVVVHPNPAVSEPLVDALAAAPCVELLAPQPFATMLALTARARFVLTDSGGLQEEAAGLGVPALVARAKTDRPESLAAGVAALVGHDPDTIADWFVRLALDDALHASMARAVPVYGDGFAADRIVDHLLAFLAAPGRP